jgi:predicted DNA-binding transcriptional regulator YafY
LEEAGIPIAGEAGVGYSIMDGYRLPPLMFTMEEATAFLTAEKLIEKLTDSSVDDSYKSAMYKVRAVLRAGEKDFLENIDERIEVVKRMRDPEEKNSVSPLQAVLRSISTKHALNITYLAAHSNEVTERNIEPIGVCLMDGRWHIMAFCQLRKDYRDFRIDRIRKIVETSVPFKKQHPALKDYLNQVTKEKLLETVVIQVDRPTLSWIGEQKYYAGLVSEKDVNDKVEMTFLTSSIDAFVRWFIMYADGADIVSPVSLKTKLNKLTSSIVKRIS